MKWTDQLVLEKTVTILKEVNPHKVLGEVTPNSSLIHDFAFDSIDIMDTMLKIQQTFLSESANLDMESFISDIFEDKNNVGMTVGTICKLIKKYFLDHMEVQNG
jgi:acyl carrier protein